MFLPGLGGRNSRFCIELRERVARLERAEELFRDEPGPGSLSLLHGMSQRRVSYISAYRFPSALPK